MKQLTLKTKPAVSESVPVTSHDLSDLAVWIDKQATALLTSAQVPKRLWLLAHSDDGINWGRVGQEDPLITSRAALDEFIRLLPTDPRQHAEAAIARQACPELRVETIQQLRLFNEQAELILWREGVGIFRARIIRDEMNPAAAKWCECYDENQMLWGTHGISLTREFTLLRDGAQGLRHAIPCEVHVAKNGETTPPRLVVRHYLAKNEDFARVSVSRLVKLS